MSNQYINQAEDQGISKLQVESPDLVTSSSSGGIPDHHSTGIQEDALSRHISRESDSYIDEYEDLENYQIRLRNITTALNQQNCGSTKPLRVRKKKGVTAIKVGSKNAKKRRSTLSFPHSPSISGGNSPKPFTNFSGNLPKRNPSSTSTKTNLSKTHANISNIFLGLPSCNDSPTFSPSDSLSIEQTLDNHSSTMLNMDTFIGYKRERIMLESSLHLGLGKFSSYDPTIKPGPSPPISPIPSPTKRAFVSNSSPESMISTKDKYSKKPLPPSPLTPSRAPRKAAALLGTASSYSSSANIQKQNKNKIHGLNTKHFRPLPNSTLTEIERFFGDSQKTRKPSSSSNTKTTTKSKSSSSSSGIGIDERGNGERNLGQGETVKYKAENGSMWSDVEEEQEFAWLLSEIFALIPQPLPEPSTTTTTTTNSNLIDNNQNKVARDENENEENKWEMENFTSILSLPKPKTKKIINEKSQKGQNSKFKSKDNSFLELQTPKISRSFHKKSSINQEPLPHPWSNLAINSIANSNNSDNHDSTKIRNQHKRSISNPISPTITTATTKKLEISSPMPTLLPPPRISSKPSNLSPSSLPSNSTLRSNVGYTSTSGSDNESDSSSFESGSPPSRNKVKNRPPPLTLKRIKPSSKLPILTATTPSNNINNIHTRQPSETKVQQVKPKLEPMVKHHESNAHKTKYEAPSTPFVRPRTAPKPSHSEAPPLPLPIPLSKAEHVQQEHEQPMSFFEPVTPTESSSNIKTNHPTRDHDRLKLKEKKSWLQRVVKRPLGVGIKV
ncbi:uncharacterized protein L201_003945 [Kwoniella dendrophila CBS 6074]|uniref:Uncharacterized protein n=1 Tax=Kwoniella dendrophila CBS 6074 TaxID=1295534 RepID=A0AAX4JUH2_9TREE